MNIANQLFGTYQPLSTPVHRAPLWAKGVFILLLGIYLAATSHWGFGLAALVLVLALGALAKIPWRTWVQSLASLSWVLAILLVYYLVSGKLESGADVLLTLLTMIAASKVLLWSTPLPVLIDGFIWLCTPLKWVGVSPERVGLALALMVRSIPVIMDSWQLIQAAVAARGIKVSQFRLFIPLVIATVAYAHETGDALAARGLDREGI